MRTPFGELSSSGLCRLSYICVGGFVPPHSVSALSVPSLPHSLSNDDDSLRIRPTGYARTTRGGRVYGHYGRRSLRQPRPQTARTSALGWARPTGVGVVNKGERACERGPILNYADSNSFLNVNHSPLCVFQSLVDTALESSALALLNTVSTSIWGCGATQRRVRWSACKRGRGSVAQRRVIGLQKCLPDLILDRIEILRTFRSNFGSVSPISRHVASRCAYCVCAVPRAMGGRITPD